MICTTMQRKNEKVNDRRTDICVVNNTNKFIETALLVWFIQPFPCLAFGHKQYKNPFLFFCLVDSTCLETTQISISRHFSRKIQANFFLEIYVADWFHCTPKCAQAFRSL